MPTLSTNDAAERLAKIVEQAKPSSLTEIYGELFPKQPLASVPTALDLAKMIRSGLEAEELVDLWNVVFPAHRNVWFDEQDNRLCFDDVTDDTESD